MRPTGPGVLLGRFEGARLVSRDTSHIGVFARTGSGKDLSLIIPWAVTWPGSMILIDPKGGEANAATNRWRQGMSEIMVFDPRGAGTPGSINVMESVRLHSADEWADAVDLAMSHLAPDTLVRDSDSGVHFREMAETLLAGVILHVSYRTAGASMPDVLAYVSSCQGKIDVLIADLLTNTHLGGQTHDLIAQVGGELGPIADREMSAIWSTMMRGLHPYRDPTVADHTRTSTIDWQHLQTGDVPTTLYLIAPDVQTLGQLKPVFRVVMETIAAFTVRQGVGTFRCPLLVSWNEFPSFGWVRRVEKDIATLRGYGWRIALFCQDLDQLWNIYGEKTGIWGNLGTKIIHAPANDRVAQRICDTMIGYRTLERLVPHYRGRGLRQRVQTYVPQRSEELLLRPEEFRQWEDEYVLLVEGCPPARVGKLWWNTDPVLRGRVDG